MDDVVSVLSLSSCCTLSVAPSGAGVVGEALSLLMLVYSVTAAEAIIYHFSGWHIIFPQCFQSKAGLAKAMQHKHRTLALNQRYKFFFQDWPWLHYYGLSIRSSRAESGSHLWSGKKQAQGTRRLQRAHCGTNRLPEQRLLQFTASLAFGCFEVYSFLVTQLLQVTTYS